MVNRLGVNLRCILTTLLFLAVLMVSSMAAYVLFPITDTSDTYEIYVCSLAAEVITMFIMYLFVSGGKTRYVFKPVKATPKNDVSASLFFIIALPLLMISQITIAIKLQLPLNPTKTIIIFLLYMISVGITEEIVFRGLISEILLGKYMYKKNGMLMAVALSGLYFGLMHLGNAAGAKISGVIWQCIGATGLGMAITAIFYRTGNIYIAIAIHAVMDIASLLTSGIFGARSATLTSQIGGYDASKLLTFLLYAGIAAFLISGEKKEMIIRKKYKERTGRFV